MFPIFVRKKLILSILQKQKEGNLTDFPSYAESEGFEPPELNKGHPLHFQYRENLD